MNTSAPSLGGETPVFSANDDVLGYFIRTSSGSAGWVDAGNSGWSGGQLKLSFFDGRMREDSIKSLLPGRGTHTAGIRIHQKCPPQQTIHKWETTTYPASSQRVDNGADGEDRRLEGVGFCASQPTRTHPRHQRTCCDPPRLVLHQHTQSRTHNHAHTIEVVDTYPRCKRNLGGAFRGAGSTCKNQKVVHPDVQRCGRRRGLLPPFCRSTAVGFDHSVENTFLAR